MAPKTRLSEALDTYLANRSRRFSASTVNADTHILRRFVAEVGDLYVTSLAAQHVDDWMSGLLVTHTCNRKMADALVTLADNQERLTRLESEWEERRIQGDRIIADFTAWRAETTLALSRWVSEQDQLAQIVRTTEEQA
jgi:hypothetical protein